MGKAGAARKLAAAAAYGGGGLTAASAGMFAVIAAEARLARRLIGRTDSPVPDATGWYGRERPGPAIRIALLGDSSAAGYGVATVEQTPGARLAAGVSQQSGRRVFIRELCRVGARSWELPAQVERTLPMRADVAVILVGANDVTHGVPPSQSVRHLGEAVKTLRDARVEVVVGTCPDLGTVRPIGQPLKQLARMWSRRLAAAQTIATVERGGRTVSLSSILGPEFESEPGVYFGPDRFHPSAEGYASLAQVLVPVGARFARPGPAERGASDGHPRRGRDARRARRRTRHADARHGARRHRHRRPRARPRRPLGDPDAPATSAHRARGAEHPAARRRPRPARRLNGVAPRQSVRVCRGRSGRAGVSCRAGSRGSAAARRR